MISAIVNTLSRRFRAKAQDMEGLEDGVLRDNGIVWGQSLTAPCFVARGMKFKPHALAESPLERLLENRRAWQSFLRTLPPDEPLQIHCYKSSDLSAEIEHYRLVDDESAWVRRTRLEMARRADRDMQARKLVKPQFWMFATKQLPPSAIDDFEPAFNACAATLERRLANFSVMDPEVPTTMLTREGHEDFLFRMLNPGQTEAAIAKRPKFNPKRTILENFGNAGIYTDILDPEAADPIGAFEMDGFYHGCLVIRELPPKCNPLVLRGTVENSVENLHIAVTIRRRDNSRVIALLKDEIDKATNAASPVDRNGLPKAETHQMREAKREKKQLEARLESLQSGTEAPFDYLFCVRTWARTRERLEQNILSLRAALEGVNGMAALYVGTKAGVTKFFFHNLAGNTGIHGSYMNDWFIPTETSYTPDFLPLFGSFAGNTNKPKLLCHGMSNNLVGLDFFAGGNPKAALIVGATRSGKSVSLAFLFSQMPYVDFGVILDEGKSHAFTVRALGGRSITISPNGRETFNYFDTFGGLLTPKLVSGMAAVIKSMGAKKPGADDVLIDTALTYYVNAAFAARIEEYFDEDDERKLRVEQEAYLFHRFLQLRIEQGAEDDDSLEDEFLSFKLKLADPQDLDITRLHADPNWEEGFIDFIRNKDNRAFVIRYAVSKLATNECLRHRDVLDVIRARPNPMHDKEMLARISAVMGFFSVAEGSNGPLFDGYTTFQFDRKWLHFELGQIDANTNGALKAAATFLILTFVRNKVTTMPRNKKKVVAIEELAKALLTEGFPHFFNEMLAQFPKYQALPLGILQSIAQLDQAGAFNRDAEGRVTSPIGAAIGNIKVHLILRQLDGEVANRYANIIGLPPSCVKQITDFPDPASTGYSCALFFSKDGTRPTVGVIKFLPSPEIRYLADSNGDEYERRIEQMLAYGKDETGIIRGVIAQARKEYAHLYPSQFALDEEDERTLAAIPA